MSKSESLKIISFDPASTRNLGWSVIEGDYTGVLQITRCSPGTFVFNLPSDEKQWKVLGPVFDVICEILLKEAPNVVVVEKTSSFAGGFVTGQVSYCIGVILAACAKSSIDVEFMFPAHVKKILTGDGRATKCKVKKSVSNILKCYIEPEIKFDSEHAVDATANILCWLIDAGLLEINGLQSSN